MLSIVVWKWKGTREYTSQQVNALKRMIDANYSDPHDVVCVTDDPEGLHPDIRVIPLPAFEHVEVAPSLPSCFVRLWGFSKEFGELIGHRFLTLDIDVVITGDMRPIWNKPGKFVAWYDPDIAGVCYQGGMYAMDPGAYPEVYEFFDPTDCPAIANKAGYLGSDQAWISYCLKGLVDVPVWNRHDGVYRARNIHTKGDLQKARIVQFAGWVKPWNCADVYPELHAIWKAACES